jgi:hypothetical protein
MSTPRQHVRTARFATYEVITAARRVGQNGLTMGGDGRRHRHGPPSGKRDGTEEITDQDQETRERQRGAARNRAGMHLLLLAGTAELWLVQSCLLLFCRATSTACGSSLTRHGGVQWPTHARAVCLVVGLARRCRCPRALWLVVVST